MKKESNYSNYVLLLIFLLFCLSPGCTNDSAKEVKTHFLENTVKNKLLRADIQNVKLTGRIGQEIDKILEKRILSQEARMVIAPEATEAFRTRQDDKFLKQGVKRGIWQGEFWGKWTLSAIAAYAYTGNEALKQTIQKETEDLIATQREDGYIGTYENSGLVEGNVWNVWCRKYTLWGLVEAYELLKDEKILNAAKRHTDHLMTEVGPGKIEMIKTGNFVGLPSSSILTPLVRLYRHTGEKKYLDYAIYIVDNWASNPGNPPDIVNKGIEGEPVHLWFPEAGKWTKAYEFISCIEGLLDLYQIIGTPEYLSAAVNIYDAIRENERVITGGIGYHDKLVGASAMADGLNEPCDVVYWERLSARLLELTADQSYADEIERLTYNTLMGTFNHKGDWATRRMGLNEPHLVAPLHCYTKHHQCCVANIPRGFLQLTEVALMRNTQNNELYVNLFIPGRYKVEMNNGKYLELDVVTNYPESGEVTFKFKNKEELKADIRIRRPEWCDGATVEINQKDEVLGNDWVLRGNWKMGDEIALEMSMPLKMIELPGDSKFVAFKKGPVVLSRSTLLEENIDDAIGLSNEPVLKPVEKKGANIWLQFSLQLTDGQTIQLCDYASTGKGFEKPTDPYAIKEMLANRVGSDQRVWFEVQR